MDSSAEQAQTVVAENNQPDINDNTVDVTTDVSSVASNDANGEPNQAEESLWYWSDGVKGDGIVPEFLRDEFKTVEQQAKSYNELVKKFGAFHKAPEQYKIDDVKNEKYRIKDGDENLKGFMNLAKELNMSQEGFNKVIKYFNDNVAPTFKIQQDEVNDEEELKKLGDNGKDKVKRLQQWAMNKFPKRIETIKSMAKTAEGVQMLLDMIDSNQNSGNSIPDDTAISRQAPINEGSAKKMLQEVLKEKDMDKFHKVREAYHNLYK